MRDYRSRLSVMVWAVLLTLSASLLLNLPTRTLATEVFGSPVTFALTTNALVGLVAFALACAGFEAAIRTHPNGSLLHHTYRYWALPGAAVLLGAAILPVAPSNALWLIALVATGVVLGAACIAEYHSIDPEDRHQRSARLALNVLGYALAAAGFILVYFTRSRSLVSATLIAIVAGMVATDLLRAPNRPQRAVFLYGLIVAVVMAQATWIMNYWPTPTLQVGMLLVVGFYLLVGLANQQLLGKLTPLLAAEYTGLATVAAIVILWLPVG